MNSTFRARWLASSEVISQVLFTSEQPKKNKMAFVSVLSPIKSLFGPLVIQLVWHILKQLDTSVSVKVVDTNLRSSVNIHHYSPPLLWIIVNYFHLNVIFQNIDWGYYILVQYKDMNFAPCNFLFIILEKLTVYTNHCEKKWEMMSSVRICHWCSRCSFVWILWYTFPAKHWSPVYTCNDVV